LTGSDIRRGDSLKQRMSRTDLKYIRAAGFSCCSNLIIRQCFLFFCVIIPLNPKRLLGIPTAKDSLIQQALLQVLTPIFEPQFSEASYGFRPGRRAHDAVRTARQYVEEGYEWVVDLDIEKFFDRVNHDILMARVARRRYL